MRTPPYPPLPGPPRVSRALVLNSSLCSSVPGDGTTFRLFLSPGSFFIHHGFLEPVHSSANGPYLDSQMRQYLRRLTLVFSLCLPPTLHQNTSVRRAVHRGPGQELGKCVWHRVRGTASVATVSSERLLSLHDSRPP